jgi:hypothetical protein
MITKAQAENVRELHFGICTRHIGPRGGVTEYSEVWRRNGQVQTWKRTEDFRFPIKWGLGMKSWAHGYIDSRSSGNENPSNWHLPEDCPLRDPSYVTN